MIRHRYSITKLIVAFIQARRADCAGGCTC